MPVSKNPEKWIPVPDYENLYEVSSLGKIRSLSHKIKSSNGSKRTTKGIDRKLVTTKRGYKRIRLCKENKYKYWFVHRIVALAFLDPPFDNSFQINHKDGIKSNNKPSNLEWVTQSQNALHSLHTLGNSPVRGENVGSARLSEENVRQIKALHEQGGILQRELAEKFDVHIMTINDILRGRTWSHL